MTHPGSLHAWPPFTSFSSSCLIGKGASAHGRWNGECTGDRASVLNAKFEHWHYGRCMEVGSKVAASAPSMRCAASASAQCQIATAMMMPYRAFRVASAFLAGIVLHTLLHFAVHSGQLRSDCHVAILVAVDTQLVHLYFLNLRPLAEVELLPATVEDTEQQAEQPGANEDARLWTSHNSHRDGKAGHNGLLSLFEDSPAGSAPSGPFNYAQSRRYQISKVANSLG